VGWPAIAIGWWWEYLKESLHWVIYYFSSSEPVGSQFPLIFFIVGQGSHYNGMAPTGGTGVE